MVDDPNDPFLEKLTSLSLDNKEVLTKQIAYLLRQYAAFIIINDDSQLPEDRHPVVYIPTGLGTRPKKDEDDEEGGGSEWLIYDDGMSLATTRPELYTEHAGLAIFMQVQEKMLAVAIERSWKNLGFWGYNADYGWMLVNKYNLSLDKPELNIVNYAPSDSDFERYRKMLVDFARSGQVYQPRG